MTLNVLVAKVEPEERRGGIKRQPTITPTGDAGSARPANDLAYSK